MKTHEIYCCIVLFFVGLLISYMLFGKSGCGCNKGRYNKGQVNEGSNVNSNIKYVGNIEYVSDIINLAQVSGINSKGPQPIIEGDLHMFSMGESFANVDFN